MADSRITLTPIPRGNGSRENHGRPTMAWFFRPPRLDAAGVSLTGLPEDCFYYASAWQEHQVTAQTRKTVEVRYGEEESVVLVLDIDTYAALRNGAPVVAMREFGLGPGGIPSEDSNRRWARIEAILDGIREEELEIERDLLKAIEDDLSEAIGDPNYRRAQRERRNVLRNRIARLEEGIDYRALRQFFIDEAVRSQALLRRSDPAQEAALRRMVEQVVDSSGAVVSGREAVNV